jgi:hypothetical protein
VKAALCEAMKLRWYVQKCDRVEAQIHKHGDFFLTNIDEASDVHADDAMLCMHRSILHLRSILDAMHVSCTTTFFLRTCGSLHCTTLVVCSTTITSAGYRQCCCPLYACKAIKLKELVYCFCSASCTCTCMLV